MLIYIYTYSHSLIQCNVHVLHTCMCVQVCRSILRGRVDISKARQGRGREGEGEGGRERERKRERKREIEREREREREHLSFA